MNKFKIFCQCPSDKKYQKLLDKGKKDVETSLDIVNIIKSLRIIE